MRWKLNGAKRGINVIEIRCSRWYISYSPAVEFCSHPRIKGFKGPFYYAHARRRGLRGTYLPRPVLSGGTTSEVEKGSRWETLDSDQATGAVTWVTRWTHVRPHLPRHVSRSRERDRPSYYVVYASSGRRENIRPSEVTFCPPFIVRLRCIRACFSGNLFI